MTSRHRAPFASAPAKKTSVGPRPDDRQARGPSRVSSRLDSTGTNHTVGMVQIQARFACRQGSLPLARSQAPEHRVERLPERRSGHVGVPGARDKQTAQPGQAPNELSENVGVEVGDLSARD